MSSHLLPDELLQDEVKQLREENARLKSLLEAHGITWKQEPVSYTADQPTTLAIREHNPTLDPAGKVSLFRSLFRGRTDVYPLRWESAKGKSGYAPACGNEWRSGVCWKPRIKCADCEQRMLLPVTDQVVFEHLTGRQTIGVYPLLTDDTCWFLAVDFDEEEWRDDAHAFMLGLGDIVQYHYFLL